MSLTVLFYCVFILLLQPILAAFFWLIKTGVKIFVLYCPAWIEATAAGLGISPWQFVMMHLRKNPVIQLVETYKLLVKAGVKVSLQELEAHYMCGGSLNRVADAAVSADKAGIMLNFKQISAIDLAGRNVVEAVESHVNPKVLLCPAAGSGYGDNGITSVARDGVKLAVKARITVRTCLEKMVGGAGEETVVARIGEGIVAAVGKADSHRRILEQPEIITQNILERGLDAGTCFEILSVDISSVDVVDNAAAALQCEQAAADKRIAQARAEERRASAVASCQEMKARTMEMQIQLTSARKRLPQALAKAVDHCCWGGTRPVPDWMNFRKIHSFAEKSPCPVKNR